MSLGMENLDDRCHCQVTDCGILQVNRGNSLATGLDHILDGIGDFHVTIRVNCGDIIGIEPKGIPIVEKRLSSRQWPWLLVCAPWTNPEELNA